MDTGEITGKPEKKEPYVTYVRKKGTHKMYAGITQRITKVQKKKENKRQIHYRQKETEKYDTQKEITEMITTRRTKQKNMKGTIMKDLENIQELRENTGQKKKKTHGVAFVRKKGTQKMYACITQRISEVQKKKENKKQIQYRQK